MTGYTKVRLLGQSACRRTGAKIALSLLVLLVLRLGRALGVLFWSQAFFQ